MNHSDVDILENWWVEKSRKNFFAYRRFIRSQQFTYGWFLIDLSKHLQQFFIDYKAGKKPVLIIQTPPQHGKSWSIIDLIPWMIGLTKSELRIIYASYSGRLGSRANSSIQRTMDSDKYKMIFPDSRIPDSRSKYKRTDDLIELLNADGEMDGFDHYFRNTTVNGSVTGESTDIGVIDDPVKGRAEANSETVQKKTWEWFTDDFWSRFSEDAGLIMTTTRWGVKDLAGMIIAEFPNAKVVNYEAIATKDEEYRKMGDPLFPELKSIGFLEKRKGVMFAPNWESLYQGNPTTPGGDKFKDSWWGWWEVLPKLLFKFIVADTAQKKNKLNDYTDFQCWGYGVNGQIYLLDHFHEKVEAPELRREAELFYRKHDTKKVHKDDPTLRGMWIEDKSSGIGLIQELRRLKLKVKPIPHRADKILRSEDTTPYIESGVVHLNTSVNKVSVITKEGREFPNGEHDDSIDNVMNAVEVIYIYKLTGSSLKDAMEAA